MIPRIALLILIAVCLPVSVFAQANSPEALREEAKQQVLFGFKLVGDANKLLETRKDRAGIEVAHSLYIEAGKMFEGAAMRYEKLVPDYVTEADLKHVEQAIVQCIQNAKRLKAILNR